MNEGKKGLFTSKQIEETKPTGVDSPDVLSTYILIWLRFGYQVFLLGGDLSVSLWVLDKFGGITLN